MNNDDVNLLSSNKRYLHTVLIILRNLTALLFAAGYLVNSLNTSNTQAPFANSKHTHYQIKH